MKNKIFEKDQPLTETFLRNVVEKTWRKAWDLSWHAANELSIEDPYLGDADVDLNTFLKEEGCENERT